MKILFTFTMMMVVMLSQTMTPQTWVQQTSGTDSTLFDIYFVNQDKGFACGINGIVLKTTNGGTNWTVLATGITDGFQVIKFLNADSGFVFGSTGGILLKTTNGGTSFNNIGPNLPGQSNGGMWFTSVTTGCIAVGSNYSNSKILKTHNGGTSWDTVYSGSNWISYFYFSDANHGWATASGGTVLKTTDGGNNWTTLNTGGNYWMSGVYFSDPNNGLVGGGYQTAGSFPTIWKTTDSGINWAPVFTQNSNVWVGISKIVFPSINIGYAINATSTGAGALLKTTNGGSSWANEATPKGNLRSLFFTGISNGYTVGDGGIILKFSGTTGVPNKETSIPVFFSLSQNYPNPFNPSTTIGYSLGENSHVRISVFDVIGKEITTLVDEEKSAENYAVKFDAKDLSSGIYFYRLQTDEFTQTKKLILLQ